MMARIRGGSVNSGRGTKRKQQPLTNLLLGPSETRYDRDFATNIPASQTGSQSQSQSQSQFVDTQSQRRPTDNFYKPSEDLITGSKEQV
jgi:hypothetical protein